MSASVLEHHLATCTDCARWERRAVQVTRRARLADARVPDLAETITAHVVLPAGRVLRRRLWLRAALVLVAIGQLGIAIPAIPGDSVGMTMSLHASHEMAAWNLAIGVAVLACAVQPRRASGLLPLLGTFVLVLGALCVHDLAAGAVGFGRVSTHFVALAALVLLVALERTERALPPRRAAAASDPGSGEDTGHLRGVA